MNETSNIAWWLLLTAKDTPETRAVAWAEQVRSLLAPHAPGWDTRVVTAANDWTANCPSSGGKPNWRAWSESVPLRYGGLIVPIAGASLLVGRATSDILENAASVAPPPHRLGWSVQDGGFYPLRGLEPNWQGDERPWKAWSKLVLDGWGSRPASRGGGTSSAAPASSHVDAFLSRCDEVIEYAEDVLADRQSNAAADFLDGIREKIDGMRSWAEEHDHVTDKMETAVENMNNGVAKWDR